VLYPLDAIESTLVDSRAHPVAAAADRLAESALLQQIARGDRAAVWQLWHRHRAYLYRRCLHWTDHPSDADEALSRAGLRAWENVSSTRAIAESTTTSQSIIKLNVD